MEILSKIVPTPVKPNDLTNDEKIKKIADNFRAIMETLGLDLTDDSLKDTPRRVAKMYVNETFEGLDPSKFPKLTSIKNKLGYDEMIVVKNISILSVCEHHFQTIDGQCTIAYIPNKKVIGLSKLNRIARYFARRPQVQERLTKQIADCLELVLESKDVAVMVNARHYCVISRGVEDAHSTTLTSDLRGEFRNNLSTRSEFLAACKGIL